MTAPRIDDITLDEEKMQAFVREAGSELIEALTNTACKVYGAETQIPGDQTIALFLAAMAQTTASLIRSGVTRFDMDGDRCVTQMTKRVRSSFDTMMEIENERR